MNFDNSLALRRRESVEEAVGVLRALWLNQMVAESLSGPLSRCHFPVLARSWALVFICF